MGNNQEFQRDISEVGAERRVCRRDSIYLQAVIKSGRSRTRSCKVLNYCSGGMFLTFDELPIDKVSYAYLPQHDDIVNIACQISASSNIGTIHFHGRIARVIGNNAGLAFINPDLANIKILKEISQTSGDDFSAKSTTLPTTAPTTAPTTVSEDHRNVDVEQTQPIASQIATPDKPTEPRQVNQVNKTQSEPMAITDSTAVEQTTSLKNDHLIDLCNQIYIGNANRYLEIFLKEIDKYLFQAAKDEHNASKQNEYFSDRDKINGESKNFRLSFSQSINAHIVNYTPDQSLHKMQTKENLEDKYITLSLVDDEDFDEWLADTVAIDHIETCYRQELIALDRRLSEIWCKRIHKDNNVYGPYILSNTFQKTIKIAGLKHHTNIVCYKLFENVLLKHLGDLYSELNQLLVSRGIVPDIQYSVKIEKQPNSSSKAEAQLQVEQQNSVTSEQAAQSNVEVAQLSVDVSLHENSIEHKSEPGQIGTDELTVPQKKNQHTPIKHDEIAMQDLYQIVGELRELQTAIKSQLVRNDTGRTPAANSTDLQVDMAGQNESSIPVCSPDELVGIIAQLQPKIDEPIVIDENPEIFKSRVMAKLVANDGKQVIKRIGQRENRIIDVAGYLFHSIMNDQQVAEGVRSWIKRLEVPVLKIALVDDSLFIDRSHIVRQVINKIADLELLSKEGGDGQQFIVRKAIDWLIGLINTEFDGSSEVFARAEKQLNLLLDIQTRTFNENVKRVIDTSKLEDKDLSQTLDDHSFQVVESDSNQDEQTQQWINKIQRLQEGDWFVFDLKKDNPFRLRLAWIAVNTKRYIFVTVNGKKDRVLYSNELITQLRDGEVVILDNASESVMDRAQFSMLQDLHKKLIHQSTHDQLTGLMGRREFEKRLDQAVNQAKCTEKRFALFFMDLDQFQVINNACGYEAGDTLLVEAADILQSFVGEKGVLARVGGDEFALLLSDRGLEDALDDADHIIHALAEHRFTWQGDLYTTTISMGLVPVTKVWEESSALLQAAESSCGLAKDIGGNRVQLYHTAHDRLTRKNKHIKWISEIEHALGNDKMELSCQKIAPACADSGFRNHYEILLVVRDDDGNKISIQEFIEAAEWYHRIGEIDRWVIHHSFNWIADNPTVLNNIDGFSINLSGRSLNDETLMEYIEDQFRQSGVPPEKVCFEVTETAGISNLSDAAHFIECIKETGCKFSLDDFGSGMSSYAYLKNLPIDYLKIDGSFVKDMVNNANDTAVVKSICEIGHFMGKKIIAECVENEETRLSLTAIGVDYVQGYGIEKPILLADLYL